MRLVTSQSTKPEWLLPETLARWQAIANRSLSAGGKSGGGRPPREVAIDARICDVSCDKNDVQFQGRDHCGLFGPCHTEVAVDPVWRGMPGAIINMVFRDQKREGTIVVRLTLADPDPARPGEEVELTTWVASFDRA